MERRIFHLVLATLTTCFVALFATLEPARLVAFVADGAGYYLQLARNAAGGRGITFDGIHATNGFHPLWLAVLIVVFEVARGTPEILYRSVGILDVGILAVASLTFHRTLSRLLSPSAALAGGAVFAASAFLNVNLMETALVLAATSALFAYAWCHREHDDCRLAPALGFGLILGSCILARLDAGFLALAIGAVDLAHIARRPERRRQHIVRLVAIVVGASVLVLPYLAYNRIAFGAMLPVSGRLESVFPHANARGPLEALRTLGPVRATFWLAGVAYLPAYVLWHRRRANRATAQERFLNGCVALLAAACLVHSTHEMLFIRWQLPWHYWMLIPLGGAITGVASQHVADRFPGSSWRRFVVVALALVVLGWAIQRRVRVGVTDSWRSGLYDASVWIRDNVEPDARLAMRDAEIPGFFSERQVVDILGLGNDLDLQDVIREGRLRGYLAQCGVRYLVQMNFPDGLDGGPRDLSTEDYDNAAFRVISEVYGTESDPIPVRRGDEVYRSPSYVAGGRARAIVVWRLGARSGGS